MQEFIDSKKVIEIRNIIDPKEIKSRAKEQSLINFNSAKINIVSVGRLVNHKAFELAIGAINNLISNGHNVHLYIVGEGVERNFLENEIKRLKLTNHCTLLGFQNNPYPFIKKCDIYLQTSRIEGLGRTIIEAALLCKPIVTTNFPTAFSILQDNITGLIAEMNSQDISKSIERLIENKKLKNNLIENLRKKEDWEKEKTLDSIYKLLNS
ncbi:group 1 glycosyl transferase [Cellulophaga geojensis KL-A]|uniref:Group 1 glycosyl transferase n=1 Tax=Cellulophaga geojensis KL-A TaxID=1328323 RepID=A0ABN0RQE5_9FLAO|nr:glycosyltransferase [Cellulophaga geojensis]EWH14026.1 group 1 glycosyl transferase [Cellulophaga geojensis KL-A]